MIAEEMPHAPTVEQERLVRPVTLAPDWHPLNCIDEFILACGWTWEPGGFVPPESWVEKIAPRYGYGRHWSRTMAAQFCIQYYQEGHAKIPWPNVQSEPRHE